MARKLLLALLLCATVAVAQCPPGNVTFSNQAQVDNFLTAYPNCTQINGSVFIDPSSTGPISNLNALQNIETITGSVMVTEHSVTISNLNGLNNLKHIGGNLFIHDTWINDISGLSSLEYVGGNFQITSNHIGDFSPLNNITYVGGDFLLGNDASSCAASGLNLQLTHVPGDMAFNPNCNSGNFSPLAQLQSVGGDLTLISAHATNLTGLGSLQSVGGILAFQSCPQLQNLTGLSSLTSMGGLRISGAYNLTDISALSNVASNLNPLSISGCDILNSLSGLENISAVSGYLAITNNPNLTSISSLSNADLSQITDLNIYSNPQLALCQELEICTYLINDGDHIISGNAPGCANLDQVLEVCNIAWKNLIEGDLRFDFD